MPFKTYVPSGELTWEEKIEIRKVALECAARTFQGNGTVYGENVVNRAYIFEDYLMGKKNG
jgi:hypothetical protein